MHIDRFIYKIIGRFTNRLADKALTDVFIGGYNHEDIANQCELHHLGAAKAR
jgi:hypothetical protein